MAIKLTGQARITRETTAPFVVQDEKGVETTEKIRVRYYSLSVKESKEFRARLKQAEEEGGDIYLSDLLAPLIASLPDIVDDAGNPVPISADILAQVNTLNLRAIQKAIEDDLSPK